MRLVTHREMRNNSGEILRAVAAGESVQVTNHGQLAAVISPPSGTVMDELVARGLARRPRRSNSELSTIQRRRATVSTQQLIDGSRGRW